MHCTSEQVIDLIDSRNFFLLHSFRKSDLFEVFDSLEEKYKIIGYIAYSEYEESLFDYLEQFVELNLSWQLLAGTHLRRDSKINFNESWYSQSRIENLTNAYIYIFLLQNIINRNLPLTDEFVNHYLLIKDQENDIFWYLIQKGLGYDGKHDHLKAFLKYTKIKRFELPEINSVHVERKENVLQEIKRNEKIEGEIVWDILIERAGFQTCKLISKEFDKLNIENQIRFVNKLRSMDEEKQFLIICDNSNEDFLEYIWENDFIKTNFQDFYTDQLMNPIFLRKLLERIPELRKNIMRNMLMAMHDENFHYVFPEATGDHVVELIMEIIEN